jgi:RNA polymerase sigma-70 factor (ECF subfamily)
MQQTGSFNETAVVDRTRNGDSSAFVELVGRHEAGLYRMVRLFVQSQEEAEEVLQATFIEAYENVGKSCGNCAVRPWLVGVAVRLVLAGQPAHNDSRAVALDAPVEFEETAAPREALAWEDIPDSFCALPQNREALTRALESLHPALRAVFVLRDIEGISTEESAALLRLPAQAVRLRLRQARMELRDRLSAYFTRAAAHESQR